MLPDRCFPAPQNWAISNACLQSQANAPELAAARQTVQSQTDGKGGRTAQAFDRATSE